MKGKLLKGGLTVLGAIFLSTLGIYASDGLQGIRGQLAQLQSGEKGGICNEGSVPVKVGAGIMCVDMYEASASDGCPHRAPASLLQSDQNLESPECFPTSVQGKNPWAFVSLPQAQRLCALVGKRLPTSAEWYSIALGTKTETCVIATQNAEETGTHTCSAPSGAHDMVGNLWEWVQENIVNTTYQNRSLPEEGYVTSVDADGVAITVDTNPDSAYGEDYFWSKSEGVFGMIRGGFYGSGNDAGLYTVNASVPTSFAAQGVGFRCVSDVLN
jgi:formylglycine-generating enzyme required for sulfatase activity